MASDPTLPPGPRGIPARLKLLEQRIEDLEEEYIAQHGREGPALAETKRLFEIVARVSERLTALETDVQALQRRRRR